MGQRPEQALAGVVHGLTQRVEEEQAGEAVEDRAARGPGLLRLMGDQAEEIAQRAAEDPGPCENDGDNDDGDNTTGGGSGSAWDDAIAGEQDSDPGEDDPYGLFEDKPYIDPDEDEDEDDPGDGIDPDEPWR